MILTLRPLPVYCFLFLLIGLGIPQNSFGQPASNSDANAEVKFNIKKYEISGNTLLKEKEIEQTVAPYTGENRNFGDIQKALEALEQVYRKHGYGSTQVILPEQDITRGVVSFEVIESHIGKVLIEGNKNYDAANIRYSLPTITEGSVPDVIAIGRNLQMVLESPTKQTTVLLRNEEEGNQVDADIKINDQSPLRFFSTLDNSGTRQTGGNERLAFGLQDSNLLDRDQMLSIQYMTSPTEISDVKIFGAGYHIPLYTYYSSIDLFAGYSNVNAGNLEGLFNVSGSGTIGGAKYNYYLPKIGEYEQKITLGVDYRAYHNNVIPIAGGESLIPNVTVHPTSINYYGKWNLNQSQLQFNATVAQNLFPGGDNGTDADFKASRSDATAAYRLYRLNVTYERLLPKDWQFRAVLNGQFTPDALVSGEQFGVGGADSLRGYNLREFANDKGYTTNLEIYTPDFASQVAIPWKDARLRALVFYDRGTVSANNPLPGELSSQTGASVGIGWRLAVGPHFNFRLDWAYVTEGTGTVNPGAEMIYAALGVVF